MFPCTSNRYRLPPWGEYKKKQTSRRAVCLWGASCRIRTNDPEITNHVLWPTELKRQVGKRFLSRRYNQVPLLRSRPGGIPRELAVGDLPMLVGLPFRKRVQRYIIFSNKTIFHRYFFCFSSTLVICPCMSGAQVWL